MLTAFYQAFRTPDLRKKLLFTLFIIVIFRLGASLPTPGVSETRRARVRGDVDQERHARPGEPAQRRRAAAADRLRARHHAVHHGEHHPAAARRGDPAARGAAPGGRVRNRQDHPVHQVPDHRPGDPAVHRDRRAGRERQPVPRLQPGADPEHLGVHDHDDGDLPDRGHRGDHVAGRADHRPRRRQRHVADDLHAGHRGDPRPALPDPGHQGPVHLHPGAGGRRADHRGRRVHGAGAAPDPGAVRQADGRPEDVRRHLDLHPAEGQPGRRHPGHLRVVAAVHPGAGGEPVRQADGDLGLVGTGCRRTWSGATTRTT